MVDELKIKTGLQAHTQLFVYGLFIYNKWKGMGTLSSVDVINQYYDLRLDIFNSSYATLCTEAIERSMDNDDISPFHYKLLHFVLEKISNGDSNSINVNYSSFKMYESFWFTAFLITQLFQIAMINQN